VNDISNGMAHLSDAHADASQSPDRPLPRTGTAAMSRVGA
jgi:hypothetical protein